MNIKSRIRNIAALALLVCVTLTGCSLRSEQEADMVPAEQVIEALCKLEMTDDASAITELLGFASEEEARNVLLDGVASEAELRMKYLLRTKVYITEDEFADIAEEDLTLLDEGIKAVMKKMSCAAEKELEKRGQAVVSVKIYGIDFGNIEYECKEEAETELTEGENLLRFDGDMLIEQKYYHHLVSFFLRDITSLDPITEPRTMSVICKKTVIEINGEEKTVWMPEDRMSFSEELAKLAVNYDRN